MYRLFTSNSEKSGWRHIRRDLLVLMLLVIFAELVLRIGPIQAFLSQRLDPYENLLWYHRTMPAYKNQLSQDPDYTIWLMDCGD